MCNSVSDQLEKGHMLKFHGTCCKARQSSPWKDGNSAKMMDMNRFSTCAVLLYFLQSASCVTLLGSRNFTLTIYNCELGQKRQKALKWAFPSV